VPNVVNKNKNLLWKPNNVQLKCKNHSLTFVDVRESNTLKNAGLF